MPLRQIEIVIPKEKLGMCREMLTSESVIHYWHETSDESGCLLKFLVDAIDTEQFLDKAEQLLGQGNGYRLVMLSVDATLPRVEKKEPENEKKNNAKKEDEKPWGKPLKGLRVSREELYADISDAVRFSRIYMALVVLSTIVAALGVLRDNTAVVIGAMVIAPLLGPNVGLALSTTLADYKLGLQSVKTNLAGLFVAFGIAIALGLFMEVDADIYQVASRTEIHLTDISLALASGAAGVLAYTVGMSTAVIGVMVAVALLPPLVVAGLLIGDMQWTLAFYAVLLLMTNVICVNLAGVATFILQGVRPRTWYESKKAARLNKIAIILWFTLLLILGIIIYYA